jgi:mRNA interferase YafQ
MLPIRPTSRFKKDLKRAARQGKNIQKVKEVLEFLAEAKSLPEIYRDHRLRGPWKDFRECHLESDWLLIYTVTDFEIRPARLGTHSELFENA